MLNRITVEEIEQFRQNNPDIYDIEMLLPDMCGVVRGKRIGIESALKLARGGVMMPGSAYLLDATGQNCEYYHYGVDDGDPDYPCYGTAGTLKRVPWSKTPMAQIIGNMHQHDGTPFFANPRLWLAKIVKRLHDMGIFPVMALELEFYLLDERLDRSGVPKLAPIPGIGRSQGSTQVYGIEELYDFNEFLHDVESACDVQDLPSDTATSEYGPSQFEINLHHVNNPMDAADHAFLLKRLIKGVGRQHEMIASFMAKPFADQAGCGLHLHISLLNEKGENIFVGPPDPHYGLPIGDKLRQAIGGLANTMADTIAIYAPNANSYRRLQSGSYAPINTAWGVNNRTVSLRIPHADANSIRVEHRVAGADANPYLVSAAVLAGIHYGLVNKIEPHAMELGNAYKSSTTSELPLRWWQALKNFEESPFIEEYFGKDYQHAYATARSFENDNFQALIPPLDYQWYLRAV